MAYSKTNWVNENEPAINADNLNKIEAGIEDNSLQLESYGRTINEINNPENWVSVGTTTPTDGRKVWFANSVNLIPNNWLSGSINGTTGEPVSYGSRIYTANKIKVEPNTQYTISNFNTSSYKIINLVDGYTSNGTYIGRIGSVVNGTTITTQANCEYINVTLNDTGDTLAYSTYQKYLSNGTLKPQLQKGSTLTTYEPYIEKSIKVDNEDFISMGDLVSVGVNQPSDGRRVWFEYSRNILPENLYVATRTLNGITYTNNGNGTISFSGTATANTSIQIIPDSKMSFKAGQPYYLYSSVPYNSTTFNLSIALTENGATRYLLANGTYTPTYNSTQARLDLYVPNGTTISATNVKLMLVKGNTAPSQYEPYVDEGIYVDEEELHFDNYSTSEQVIGKWIDGKPLYRKVITFGALANNGNKTIPYGSSNNLIKFDIYAKNPTSGYLFKVPLGGTNYINSYVELNFHQIVVQTNSDRTTVTDNYVIIEYTKTTG